MGSYLPIVILLFSSLSDCGSAVLKCCAFSTRPSATPVNRIRLYTYLSAKRPSSPAAPSQSAPASAETQNSPDARRIIPRDEHTVSRSAISKNALNVIYALNRAGFEAYLVGGSVRDLLLGQQPKDFDVATDARPEEVKDLFRRARIVGRRFKIVHVRFGREIIEVTTFRAAHDSDSSGAKANQQGMLLRDNVYGNLKDDALRRDFSVNALYYSVDGFTVIDYANGLADLQQRSLRIIGDPETRYTEDPVRMLRAVRFAAKLDFTIDPASAAPLAGLAHMLGQVAPARLFDELLKVFMNGHAETAFALLEHHQMLAPLLPASPEAQDSQSPPWALVRLALANTDSRVREDKPVTPGFLFAALLWPALCQRLEQLQDMTRLPALQRASAEVLAHQQDLTALPRRFSTMVREIWTLQQRLENAHGRRARAVLLNPRFRAAYDFLLLRSSAGEPLQERCDFWTALQQEHPVPAGEHSERPPPRKRRRRRPRRRRAGERDGNQAGAGD